MMFQQITIIGRLGRDPEMRYTSSGTAVTSFSVATDCSWTAEKGAVVKETIWFRVQVWNMMAEAVNEYLAKGKLVMVQGRLTCDPKTGGPRIWKDQDDLVHATFEINASTIKFLSPRSEGATAEAAKPDDEPNEWVPAEEIPF